MRFKETDKVGDLIAYAKEHDDLSRRISLGFGSCGAISVATGYDDWTIRELCNEVVTRTYPTSATLRRSIGQYLPHTVNEDLIRRVAKDKKGAKKMLERCKDLTNKEIEILEESNG